MKISLGTHTLLSAACLLHTVALAQEATPELTPLRVNASRMPAAPSQTGASLSVITSDDLQNHGNLSLGAYLRTVPGIHFAQSGPQGSVNSLVMRGATQKYMLIRVDGVNVSDPSAGQIAPEIEHILLGNIERIEILRGSQSSLYGGQAVAGVIEITTRDAKEGVQSDLMVEAGSYDTYQGQASVRAGTKRGFITADAQVYDSEGFSAADENAGNSEKDGYENTTLGLRGGYQFNESVSLRGSVKHSDHTIEFDAFEFGVGPVDDDGSNLTRGDHTQAMAGMTYDRLEGKQIHDLQLTYYRTNRDTEGTFPASFRGDRKEAEYLMRVEINPALGLLAGANATEETAETNSGIDESNTLYGIFAQVDFLPVEQMILSLTLRNDDHSEFGSQSSWKATSAYSVSDATRLRGSVGTGFRAPSLFELYDSQLGNPDLDPETSISWELGIDQNLWDEKGKVALTYFQLDVTDQIEYVFPTGYSQVEGESNRNGVEVSLTYEPSETLLLQTSYTYMIEAENTSGEDLLRVPEHDVSVSAVASCGDWIFSALLSYVAGVQDLNYRPDGPPVEELDAYWVMGGRMAYQLNAHTEIYLRVENLFDEQYQETRGYGTPDRSAYAGVRLEL